MTNFIRLPKVQELTGLSKSTIYEWIKQGKFPSPYKIGIRVSAWSSEEISVWIEEKLLKGEGYAK